MESGANWLQASSGTWGVFSSQSSGVHINDSKFAPPTVLDPAGGTNAKYLVLSGASSGSYS